MWYFRHSHTLTHVKRLTKVDKMLGSHTAHTKHKGQLERQRRPTTNRIDWKMKQPQSVERVQESGGNRKNAITLEIEQCKHTTMKLMTSFFSTAFLVQFRLMWWSFGHIHYY